MVYLRPTVYHHRAFVLSLALLLAGIGLVLAQSPDTAFRIESYQWVGKAQPGSFVRVTNPYGDIRSRASEDGRIHLLAVIQKFSPDHDAFRFEIGDDAQGRLTIVPRYEGGAPLGQARVDVSLLLPPGTHLDATTTDGMIKVRRFASEVVARSASGRIKIVSALPVTAATVSGDISVRLTQRQWERPSWLESDSGDVHVTLAADAQMGLQVRTGGRIYWQHSEGASAERLEFAGRRLSAELGEGGAVLEVVSRSGDVRVEDMPYPRSGEVGLPGQGPDSPCRDDLGETPRHRGAERSVDPVITTECGQIGW